MSCGCIWARTPSPPDEHWCAAVYKPRWGAFFKTPLDDHLRQLGVTTLMFAGCNFPNCHRTSMYEASERDYGVVLAEDAVSGLYEQGRQELMGIGVKCLPTRALIERVRATG